MAKRSDFAQKLLDDLRLRKERMAATSQGSSRTNAMAIDAYTYSKQTYRGSRDMKPRKTSGIRIGNMHNQSSGGNILLTVEEASKQVVPFGRGNRTEQIDLSAVLAFALENGGKYRRMESSGNVSMLSFLQQIGKGSVNFGKMERRNRVDRHQPSTSHVPTLSQLHIKEISKGAQKLNQILRACSSGLNFEGYSVEIGKELLKGAMDLEESLRMLANLQDASEKMPSTQRKNRITLLEDDEDNDNNTAESAEQKQLARPRFSFDKSSKNSHNPWEVARTTSFDHGNQSLITLNSASHVRSASYDFNVKTSTASSGQNNQLSSSTFKSEKGRIPNVIAKLMGLDKLPENVDLEYIQKSSVSKPKVEEMPLKKNQQPSLGTGEQKTTDRNSMASNIKNQKVTQAKKSLAVQGTPIMLKVEKHQVTRNASFEVVHDGQPQQKDIEGIKLLTSPLKTTSKTKKEQSSSIPQFNQYTESRNQEKEKTRDNTKYMEQRGAEGRETKKQAARDERQLVTVAPLKHERPEAAIIFQEKQVREKRTASKLLPRNQQKPSNEPKFQQPDMRAYHAREKEQQSAKQKSQVSKQQGTEAIFKTPVKPLRDAINLRKKQPHLNQAAPSKESVPKAIGEIPFQGFSNSRHHEDHFRDKISSNSLVYIKDSKNTNAHQISSVKDLESKVDYEKGGNPPVTKENLLHVPVLPKVKNNMKTQKSEIPQNLNEVMTRRNGALHNILRPLKNQGSVLHELKLIEHNKISASEGAELVRASRPKEAEAHASKSRRSEAGIEALSVAQPPQKEANRDLNLHSHAEDECQQVEDLQILPPNHRSLNICSTVTNDEQGEAPVFCEYDELPHQKIVSDPLNGPHDGVTDISYSLQLKKKKISKSEETQESLTESEVYLKQILIKSQLFLDAAEALFKLKIPLSILHDSGHDHQDESSKIILDCGYEVMKRKGRRQELSLHPCVKIPIIPMKVSSLDDLVKQLQKNFEKLKSYGKNGHTECEVEDYLPKMLESDVQKGDPNINCMWDLGWNEDMFAVVEKDEVIKDVERQLTNRLLDEITLDFLHV